ncbi:uncharacterized protein [Ptychodera flava]|uniref:uncharacterized protein n=1 Tax=Ptychodera flava TaxID=63121 RepID=UPI00396AB0FA
MVTCSVVAQALQVLCLLTIGSWNFRVYAHAQDHDHSNHHQSLDKPDGSDLKFKHTAKDGQAMEGNRRSSKETLTFQDKTEILNFMIGPEDFFQQYISKRKPVLITDSIHHWPAYTLWSEEYLTEKLGDETVSVKVDSQEQMSMKKMTMKEFIENYKSDPLTLSQEVYPSLDGDISVPTCLKCASLFQGSFTTDMQISSGRSRSSLHVEEKDALLCALKGNQSVTLVSPLESRNLRADEGNPIGTSPIDITQNIDSISSDRYMTFDMHEGDMLYIPSLWWRQLSLHQGGHIIVMVSWILKTGILTGNIDHNKFKNPGSKLSFSDALIQYEEVMQQVGRTAVRPQCQDEDTFMNDYAFESAKDETHDGPDFNEDEDCHFDRDHQLSPCLLPEDACDAGEEELECTRYVLEYCYEWEDRGCVVDLPQALNRLSHAELEDLQHGHSHLEP